jgi:regulator of protease activity HflC (stomatin/prohibitin superfamily)
MPVRKVPNNQSNQNNQGEGNVMSFNVKWFIAGIVVVLVLMFQPFGLVSIKETDVGVLTKKLAGKVDPEPLSLGWHLYNRWTESVETYKVSARSYPSNVKESENSDNYTLELKTADGQNVKVDMTIIYSLRAKEVPLLHQRVGIHFEDEILLPQLRSESRLAFGGYAAEDIYQGKVREEIQKGTLIKLVSNLIKTNSSGESMYPAINVTDVLIRHLQFSPEFEKAIEQKKLAAQQVEINKNLALAQEQKALQVEAEARGNKLKAIQQAEGEGQSAEARAKGEAAATRARADATKYELLAQAEGNLAKYKAEAEGKRLSAAALAGEGGQNVVNLEFAKQLSPSLQTYYIPSGVGINAIGGNFQQALGAMFHKPEVPVVK